MPIATSLNCPLCDETLEPRVSYVGGKGYEWWAQCPNEHGFTRLELIAHGVAPVECPHCGGELYVYHDIEPSGLPRGTYGICGGGDVLDEAELFWWCILPQGWQAPSREPQLQLVAEAAAA